MKVLSLFDGMSCGRIALDRAGFTGIQYFASEIDKHAIKVARANYPQTIQLGSVLDLTDDQLRALGKIDVLIGGTPCQGFSFAGKQKGSATKDGVEVTTLEQYLDLKERGFEFDGQSYLLWEYVRVWKVVKPTNFLLENVRITKKWQAVFDEAMGVKPIVINSALVSAQNRVRYYWTDIAGVGQPEDRGVLLRDVLECGSNSVNQRGRGNNPGGDRPDKSPCMGASAWQENVKVRPCEPREFKEGSTCHHAADATDIKGHGYNKRVYSGTGKAPTLAAATGGNLEPKVLLDKLYNVNPSGNGMNGNVYGVDAKSPTLTTNKGEGAKISPERSTRYRKLTPVECERLQTVPDNYTAAVSNTQRYKMLGNGWTVDVIAHILKGVSECQD